MLRDILYLHYRNNNICKENYYKNNGSHSISISDFVDYRQIDAMIDCSDRIFGA